jgi:hypothetical protein
VSQRAPHGAAFTPGCFDPWIGESIPLTLDDPSLRGAVFTLVGYRLADHRTSAVFDLEAESTLA